MCSSDLDDDMGCEAASLPIWVPSTPCCLRVGGVTSSVLLYNGRGTPQAPPVRIEGDSLVNDGSATLQHVWTYHEQTLRYIAELPPGKPVALTDGAVEDLSVGLATLVRPKLVELGLFEDEADAFVRAWADTQLASPPPWRVLAFAPKALTDSLMPLRIEPSPATTLRVLAIAVD